MDKLNTLKMEVITVVAHLIITIMIVLGYVLTLVMGHSDVTLQNVLLLAAGFWFGMTAKVGKKPDKPGEGGDKSNE